tara:strand:- start:16839 stop:17681 length:843 start_codon:yes stop_codon:yes gene_type:complete
MKGKLSSSAIMAAVLITLLILGVHFWLSNEYGGLPDIEATAEEPVDALPDFTTYTDVKEKKEAFFDTLYPIIQEENAHVLQVREALISLKEAESLSDTDQHWLADLAQYYKVVDEEDEPVTVDDALLDSLLLRIDYIPPSLALTQAAIESGWGSSRFSRQGNNLFGHWCFVKGCGIVPGERQDGRVHEVAKFDTINHAVRAYIRNLNTHYAYDEFRDLRAKLRESGSSITGKALATSLSQYSEEGTHYIEKVSKFIDHNKLQRYTKQFEKSLMPAPSSNG